MRVLLKATVTPLASIFGSGFLVIVPILAGAVGQYSVFAMAGICLLAYAVGSIIRYNISNVEPVLDDHPGEATLSLERGSDLALILAYIISVCLYLHIMSSFVLAGAGMNTQLNQNLLTTTIITAITMIGMIRGLDSLEILEQWALYITLIIIFLILFDFGYYDWTIWKVKSGFVFPEIANQNYWESITIVAGTLIVVQGFETPRYMGENYNSQTRVQASRWSQIISTVVYLIFVSLALPLAAALNGSFDDNSLLTMAGIASGLLVVPLIIAAALSQFSAAVADTIAAAGNMTEATHQHIRQRWGYLIIGGGAIALTWSADTFQIVALASRAFAFYYLLQCLVAISVSKSRLQQAGMVILATVLGFITIFAVPAG